MFVVFLGRPLTGTYLTEDKNTMLTMKADKKTAVILPRPDPESNGGVLPY